MPPRDPYDDEDEEDEEGADEDDDREPAVIREARGRRRSPPERQSCSIVQSIAAAEVILGDISPEKVQAVELLMARAREADRAGDRECLFVPNSDY